MQSGHYIKGYECECYIWLGINNAHYRILCFFDDYPFLDFLYGYNVVLGQASSLNYIAWVIERHFVAYISSLLLQKLFVTIAMTHWNGRTSFEFIRII
jgi:hypothetical protein